MEVLDVDTSHDAISRGARGLANSIMRSDRMELADGTDRDWRTLPIKKSLCTLCAEAEPFRLAVRDAVQNSGLGHACVFAHSSLHHSLPL